MKHKYADIENINSTSLLSIGTVELIRTAIQTELLKRGFTAPITMGGHINRDKTYSLTITSEPFNTVPVIMKEIKITNFGSWVSQHKDQENLIRVSIQVNVSYEHFSGGSNGTELFSFICIVRKDMDGIFEVEVR